MRQHKLAQGHDSEHHGIELAPMLDFVLNLLIFFIMATAFVKKTGTTVDLPSADTATYRESGNILIAVRPNGQIWMDKHEVKLENIVPIISRLHAERPTDTVVILADKKSHAGVLANVMDEVHEAGIKTVAIGAEPTAGV